MRPSAYRSAFTAVTAFLLLSCSEAPTEPTIVETTGGPALTIAGSIGSVVISQLYGGGGNSGATLRNDFIELHNTGSDTANLAGWSVQYASSAGTSWQVTALSGKIPPGGFYLVQEALGSGGTVNLPTPDASGTIAMSATAGKVALASATTALSGTCPISAIDLVSFGTAATNCGGGTTPTLSNTNAAVRADTGCRVTGDITTDFGVALPAPRNSASPRHTCGAVVAGPLDHVALAGPANLTVGTSGQFVATPQDEGGVTVTTASITWGSSDSSVASIDGNGNVTALVASPTPVTITATAVDGAITRSATASLQVNNPSINWIDISSSSTSFPAGFQTQLFGTARVASGGTVIPANFTFEAVDTAIATVRTVSNSGLVTGVAAPADGTTRPGFRVTATPIAGGTPYSFITHTIFIERSNPADPSIYANNDEFGSPSPAGDEDLDDLLIERPQYTLSYNASRGTPNWVSYELDGRQMVPGQDRCNCFTADPALPAAKQIFTSDYTGGGFDRGHMTRSFDRTAGNTDNASTFYLTNIVPQMADLNQGVWAQFENALGDSASNGGRAVYIITGPLYSRGKPLTYIKGEGKVAIPDSTWKVALIGPRTGGVPFTRSAITDWSDLPGFTVLAVNMPNVAGIRNVPWATYLTTVDKIEASTGLDILSLLPTAFQDAVEAGDRRPTASFLFSGTLAEGSPVSFNASASTDPDLGRTDLGRPEALGYGWDFGGSAGSGVTPSHSFPRSGNYAVTLTVTDAFGWPSVVTKNVTIANVAPAVASLAGADLLVSESYVTTGSFADPGEGPWSATVNYGDGGGAQPLTLVGKSFALSHTYTTAGSFTVTVQVTDDAGATATASAVVQVVSAGTALADLQQEITALQGNGTLSRGEANALQASLDVAVRQLGREGLPAVQGSLGAFINKIEADVQSGRLSAAVGQGLIAEVRRILAALDA